MSTDYFAACYTCRAEMEESLASGSAFYGFKTWDEAIADFRAWLPAHEGHDVRIVSEHVELPWEATNGSG